MLRKLYSRFGKTLVRSVIGGIILVGAIIAFTSGGGGEDIAPETQPDQIVRVAPAGALDANGSGVSVIGTASAVNEAEVASEVSGQIVSVPVAIGDRVAAGSVLATFENSRERAQVLQAEGSYEAAVASAQQSDISTGSSAEDIANAEIDAWNEFRDAFIDADNIMRNTLDSLFSSANMSTLDLSEFSWERRLIRYELEDWGTRSLGAMPESGSLDAAIDEAEALNSRFAAFIDEVYEHILSQERRTDNTTTLATIATYKTELSTARSTLNANRGALAAADAALRDAEAAYARAQIAGTGSTVSAADASVKQALGSLRLAQSALEKTIVRAPIAGVVNTVHVKTGAYVGAASPIAMVVSEGALEVTTYLTEADRNRIAIGDTVTFAGESTGTVTRIAPAVDRTTQKYEVKVSPNGTELKAGDVVRITLTGDTARTASDKLYIPLTAVKLTADKAVVFTVAENVLVEHPVTLGVVRGTAVAIDEGLTREMTIVVDARGLSAGDTVRIVD